MLFEAISKLFYVINELLRFMKSVASEPMLSIFHSRVASLKFIVCNPLLGHFYTLPTMVKVKIFPTGTRFMLNLKKSKLLFVFLVFSIIKVKA